ncbi:MAG: hypothetical protein ACREVJ_14125, partial [Gammaproteobacteria bacterium]
MANPRTIYRSTARITALRAACHAGFRQGCFPRRFAAASLKQCTRLVYTFSAAICRGLIEAG